MNSYTRPAWEAAVVSHEKEMYPIETVVASKLRAHFVGAGDRPQQLLREFAKYVPTWRQGRDCEWARGGLATGWALGGRCVYVCVA